MNKLKRIYYPVLATLALIALVLGFVASAVDFGSKSDAVFVDRVKVHLQQMDSVHNSYESSNLQYVRNTGIVNVLSGKGFTSVRGNSDSGYDNANIAESDGKKVPSYIVQEATLDADTLSHMSDGDELYYFSKTVYNVVAVIPGSGEGVTLFTANYDSAAKSSSGIESMQAATLLEKMISVVESGKTPVSTLLFVFTDAEHEGAAGAYAFRYQFKGFGGIAEKVDLAINLGANGSSVLAVSADKVNIGNIKGYSSGLGDAIDGTMDEVSDYDVYDTAKINLFFTGNKDYINTQRDTVKNVSDEQIRIMGGALDTLISAYGYNEFTEGNGEGSFSYLGATISVSKLISYVLGGVAALLLVAAIAVMILKGLKTIGIVRGFFSQIVALIFTAIILYACYFIIMLLLAGFGAVPINAIITVKYMNIGVFIASLILAFAAYSGVLLLLRRFYGVKSTEAARGGALLIMLFGIVMSFALPNASPLFAIAAILEGLALIITSLWRKKFNAKYGDSVEKLFLYNIPLILLTPAVIPVLIMTSYSLNAIYFPLILTVAALGLSAIAPYFGLTKKYMTALVKKLPKHTIRVEKVITEQVEGPKKGRFHEVTHKKVFNEKVEWNYHNRYGVTALAILSAILVIIFAAAPARHISTNAFDSYTYREAVKDNAIVYTWEQIGKSTADESLRIYDKAAYERIRRIDNSFTWNKTEGAYERELINTAQTLLDTSTPVNVVVEKNKMTIQPYGRGYSFINIKLSNMSQITSINVTTDDEDFVVDNADKKSDIVIELPYSDYASVVLEFEYEGQYSIGLEFSQYCVGERTVQSLNNNLSDYSEIISNLSAEERSEINGGMIFFKSDSYTLTNA